MKSPSSPQPMPSLSCPVYLEDMRSRIGELAFIVRAAAEPAPATLPEDYRASRLRFIDRLDAVHDYLVGLIVANRKAEKLPATSSATFTLHPKAMKAFWSAARHNGAASPPAAEALLVACLAATPAPVNSRRRAMA